jgi:hypothetical protein
VCALVCGKSTLATKPLRLDIGMIAGAREDVSPWLTAEVVEETLAM